jgi:hypothetical protein
VAIESSGAPRFNGEATSLSGGAASLPSSFGRSWLAESSLRGAVGIVAKQHRRCIISCTPTLPSTIERPPRREDRGELGDRVGTGEDGVRAIADSDITAGDLACQCRGMSSCSPRACCRDGDPQGRQQRDPGRLCACRRVAHHGEDHLGGCRHPLSVYDCNSGLRCRVTLIMANEYEHRCFDVTFTIVMFGLAFEKRHMLRV